MEKKGKKAFTPAFVKKIADPAKQKMGDTVRLMGDTAKKAAVVLEEMKDNAVAVVTEKMNENKLTSDFIEQIESLTPLERTYLWFEPRKPDADGYIGRYVTLGRIRINILWPDTEILNRLDFPREQPVAAGKMYIEHPLKPRLYLPYDRYFDIIAKEQREEIEGALLALGAQVYTFEYWEYEKDSVKAKKSFMRGVKAATEADLSEKGEVDAEARKEHRVMERTKVDLKPQTPRKPKLLWLKGDPKWIGIIERCLSGAGGTWEYTFECSKNTSFSLEDAKDIDGAVAKLQGKLVVGDFFQMEFDRLRQKAFNFKVIF